MDITSLVDVGDSFGISDRLCPFGISIVLSFNSGYVSLSLFLPKIFELVDNYKCVNKLPTKLQVASLIHINCPPNLTTKQIETFLELNGSI